MSTRNHRRDAFRLSLRLPGRAHFRPGGRTLRVLTRNISALGCLCECEGAVNGHESVHLMLSWPFSERAGSKVKISGTLVRTGVFRSRPAFALAFSSPPVVVARVGLNNNKEQGRTDLLDAFRVPERVLQCDQRLQRVDSMIDRNLSRDLSLQDAANAADMERTYFSEFFHRRLGLTFRQWLRCRRVARAIELVGNRNFSVSELASEVGFHNPGSFARAFKKLTNLTPLEFKKFSEAQIYEDEDVAVRA